MKEIPEEEKGLDYFKLIKIVEPYFSGIELSIMKASPELFLRKICFSKIPEIDKIEKKANVFAEWLKRKIIFKQEGYSSYSELISGGY